MSEAGLSPIRRALISVSDKSGIVDFARALAEQGVELLSTGGTCRLLREEGLSVIEVSDHTGFPEMMDGRVKTLHPKIHGGILGRRGTDDAIMASMAFPRSISWSSTSTPSKPPWPTRTAPGRRRGEYRHWRPDHGARSGKKPSRCHDCGVGRRLPRSLKSSNRTRAHHLRDYDLISRFALTNTRPPTTA
jgi:hypothetical protein